MTDKFTHSYTDLDINQPVYFQDVTKKHWNPGTIIGCGPKPRSYTIQCERTGRMLQRNRGLLRQRKTPQNNTVSSPELLPDNITVERKEVPVPVSRPKPPVQKTQPSEQVQSTLSTPATQEKPPPTTPPTPAPRRSLTNAANIPKSPCVPIVTTRSGRVSKPPLRLIEQFSTY